MSIVTTKGVVIGSRWTPEHAIVRLGGVYWERSRSVRHMSGDELLLQRALLAFDPPERRWVIQARRPLDAGHEIAIYAVCLIGALALVLLAFSERGWL